jgi:hypothetical protein
MHLPPVTVVIVSSFGKPGLQSAQIKIVAMPVKIVDGLVEE